MTTVERAAQQQRIHELRERARHLYTSAQHADSRQGYQEDRRAAARAENEADELESQLHDEGAAP
jgi:hypothetical protein